MARFSIKRYLPRSLYGRAALILLVPIVTIQLVVSFAFIQRLYEDVTAQMTQNISVELQLLLDIVEDAKNVEEAATKLIQTANALDIDVTFPGADVRERRRFTDLSGRAIRETLDQQFETLRAVDLVSLDKTVQASLETSKGVLEVAFSRRRVAVSNPHQLLVLMLFTAVLMTVISYLFLRNQLRPIRRLARAAEAFGKGRNEPYYPGGALEVRSAGAAFLNMRARIERQIEQRTLMLSGVSHDLRTPLTRLKLGLSMQPDTEETKDLIGDVDEMERLIEAFLDFAKADAQEELERADPIDLVKDLVANAQRAGKSVELAGDIPDAVNMKLRPLSVRRAVENLINNAVRYGTFAQVEVAVLETALRISVEDNGPGIPEARREQAVKAFSRLDASRNQNAGSGVGLGLAIAADVARSHGGTLRLGDSDHLGGLKAELVLPR
ncbi:two-component system osmolarity sensor histidine kinase EnvZ [Litoreibacter halocynthiae]|uniref:histidine kinase n=1 Tax=Litoreibacter halocynthiae TaxID=1242689 RepID=A0A4R7LTI4_9RHOB|nr:ATP-binding protein [Litoreibacter halocynthiae]TDT77570.1 two-component system osmolarity sensor histidine kinase EnvZ [Litoreibacter halocynthiae]